MKSSRLVAIVALFALAACGDSAETTPDESPKDSGTDSTVDATDSSHEAAADSGVADSSDAADSTTPDSTIDSAVADSGVDAKADSALVDSAVVDSAVVDSAVVDSAVVDSAVVDSAVVDSAVADTAVADTAVADTAVADTAVADTAVADTAVADTTTDTAADTAVADTSVVDSGVDATVDAGKFSVVLAATTSTPKVGGAGGGDYTWSCPAGEAIIGFSAVASGDTYSFYGGAFGGFQVNCGTLAVSNAVWTVTPDVNGKSTVLGSSTAQRTSVTCPANTVAVGFAGDTCNKSGYVCDYALLCAPLGASGDAGTDFVGAATATTKFGVSTNVTTFGTPKCPAAAVATGIVGTSGEVLNNTTMTCSTLSVSPL